MVAQPEAELNGFPPGYFVIRSVATNRLLDVCMDEIEDGTEIILWPETDSSLVEGLRRAEANNQVFFMDTSGALCSRSSGHAIDVEDQRLVLRHRRPVSQPYPNAYSHPLPQFSYSKETKEITVSFSSDPTYPPTATDGVASSTWRRKSYILSSIPMRKPRSLVDNTSDFLSSVASIPFSFFSSSTVHQPKANPEEIFNGNIDLTEDDILEEDRGDEGEADDSPEQIRRVRVLAIDPRNSHQVNENAIKRRQWHISPLRRSIAHRSV